MIQAPQSNEYAEYYERYISLVKDGDILQSLESQLNNLKDFFSKIDEEKVSLEWLNRWGNYVSCKKSLSPLDLNRHHSSNE